MNLLFYICFTLSGIGAVIYYDRDLEQAIFFAIMMCVCGLLNIAQNLHRINKC